MFETESETLKGFQAEIRLHDALLRLVELRLEEVERRILIIDARARMEAST